VVVPEGMFEFAYASSSGPGGQNVNKKATKCQLRVRLLDIPLSPNQRTRLATMASMYMTGDGEILIPSDEHRSQARNREECVEKLAELVKRAEVMPKIRRKTKPSRGAIERRLKEKKVRGERKRGRGETE